MCRDVDLDSAVAMFNAKGELIDKVCYRQKQSHCGALTLNTDRTHDVSSSGPEIITVELGRVSMDVHYIIFAAASSNKEISLDNVSNISTSLLAPRSLFAKQVDGVQVDVSLGKEDDNGHCLHTISKRELSEALVMVGMLARDSVQWKFKPLKSIFEENDFVTVLEVRPSCCLTLPAM